MRKSLKSAMLATRCGATALGASPPEALAGPMSLAPPAAVGLTAPTDQVHYRVYRRYGRWGYYRPARWGYYRPYYRRAYYPRYYGGYYPGYYDPAGAMFAGAALGLMGAGLAAAASPGWGWGGGWGPGWGWGGGWGGGWGPGFGWGGGWW